MNARLLDWSVVVEPPVPDLIADRGHRCKYVARLSLPLPCGWAMLRKEMSCPGLGDAEE